MINEQMKCVDRASCVNFMIKLLELLGLGSEESCVVILLVGLNTTE